MTVFTNNFDYAGADATVIDVTKMGTTGTAPLSVQGSPQFLAAAASHGTKGMFVPGGSSSDTSFKWNLAGASKIDFRTNFKVSGANNGEYTLIRCTAQTATTTVAFRVRVGSSSANRKIRLTDSSGTDWFVSSADALLDTDLRVEGYLITGSGTATLQFAYFSGDSTTPIQAMTPITTGTLAPSGGFGDIQFGQWGSGNYASGIKIDDPQVRTGTDSTGLPGPFTTPLSTPVVSLGTTVNPSTAGATDGSQVVTWPAVANATSYDAYKLLNPSGSPVDGDFGTAVATGVTSPYTFTGLGAGSYAFGIKAKP